MWQAPFSVVKTKWDSMGRRFVNGTQSVFERRGQVCSVSGSSNKCCEGRTGENRQSGVRERVFQKVLFE